MSIFLVLGVVGVVVLAVSLIAGDLFDGVTDALAGDVFSSAAIGGFVAALGFSGALADAAGAPGVVAVVVGVLCGLAVGWATVRLTRLLRDGERASTAPSTGDVVGYSGRVVSAVPADGLGTVQITVRGHTLRLNARADAPLDSGTEIHVTSVLSPTAVVVAPVWDEA